MRFLADAMLERLARWLRVLDVDVATLPATTPDAEVARRAADEGRVLLTRDRGLAAAHPDSALVRSGEPLEQLREVLERFDVPEPPALFLRCLLCNVPLAPDPARHDTADGTCAGARRCPQCGRLYWEGSHTRRMRAALAPVLAARRASRPAPLDK